MPIFARLRSGSSELARDKELGCGLQGMITSEPMQSALEAIHEYYKVFSTLDLTAIASYFCEPCMSISPQGVFSAANRTVLTNALTPVIEGLKAKGYGRSEYIEPQVTILTETAALVRGVAVRYAATGQEIERLQISYLMHRSEAGWKIAMMVLPS